MTWRVFAAGLAVVAGVFGLLGAIWLVLLVVVVALWGCGLPTVFTSNWRLGEWDAFDSRLASRFGSGEVIEFAPETQDKRLEGSKERYQQLKPHQKKEKL